MASVLITAFEAYDRWQSNASWLTLVELTKELPPQPSITTRLYPVEYAGVSERLTGDLAAQHDVALHLGQSPRASCIQLEAIALNVAGRGEGPGNSYRPLVEGGPVAYQSTLPLSDWARKLCAKGIPAQVSYHAGTYLCNAALYFSLHLAATKNLKTQAAFIHLPLSSTQSSAHSCELPSMPTTMAAAAVRLILQQIIEQDGQQRHLA